MSQQEVLRTNLLVWSPQAATSVVTQSVVLMRVLAATERVAFWVLQSCSGLLSVLLVRRVRQNNCEGAPMTASTFVR
jgi:hypothetical protein